MQRSIEGMTENQQKLAMMTGATVLGAASVFYMAKKAFGGASAGQEEPDRSSELEQVSLPAIVSDIDGVVIHEKKNIPGGKEATQKLLAPLEKVNRRLPFTFMSNGGGCSEQSKADKMNLQMGMVSKSYLGSLFGSQGPKLIADEIVLSHTVLKDKSFQERFQNEWVLVDGFSRDDAALAMSYGFKKVISVKELCCLEMDAVPWFGVDFYESKLSVLSCLRRVVKRFGMTKEALRAELKFKAVILQCSTFKLPSLIQLVCDIVGSKDGTLRGERLGPKDRQMVKFITTNPDLEYSANFERPRFSARACQISIEALYKELYGRHLETECYGKPYATNYEFVKSKLEEVARKRAIKISNFYMIGDNPASDIEGGNRAGWVTILVKTGVFDPNAATSVKGNDSQSPATHVVDDITAAIDLIFRLEKLN